MSLLSRAKAKRLGSAICKLKQEQGADYSLDSYENMQLSEIAEVFGLTEGRICQIRREAVEVLRKYLKKLLA